jgi:hypothetical protein
MYKLSARMVEKIPIVKANLDTVYLAPETETKSPSDNVEEDEKCNEIEPEE